ncbi:ammonium transporter [Hydrogenovibrio sp. 3SP14C1]|uniref:ammonium transporter n=1 Tax=Hydrogenovibrio sp. 3SP14C1 TaxID=3038774 RepID=UPI002417882B|nr:ammonium transporter [Hydrogenovibrio sp. 3SP14C1]MDG4812410.1 ammonium transporter [Hydrogenovibrio sp. 3SP14C1]
MEQLTTSLDVMFILLGAILVLFMHAGFAFLEVGTVQHKNQVNALVKIMTDLGVSTIAYFFIGYGVAYGVFLGFNLDGQLTQSMTDKSGYELVKFFFLMTFAAAIPAIVSGGIAERARFYPILLATFLTVAFIYPFFEGMAWNGNFGMQSWLEASYGAPFHDFAGSIVVHAVGGWIALAAIIVLGSRTGRYDSKGNMRHVYPPSSIPFLALGAWILSVGWFGFNVMSAQAIEGIQGLVAMNSLMAMVGGILAATFVGDKDPGFIHNGPLAGLVAICAGSDVVSPLGALVIGLVAGALFVKAFTWTQKSLKIDDVLGVWPLHGLCGVWGAIAVGIFGSTALGGLGGVSMMSQILGTLAGITVALISGFVVYILVNKLMGLRMSDEDQYEGADLSIHKIHANPPREEF